MRIIETQVFKFNELPLAVQDAILESWDETKYDWWNSIYSDSFRVGVKLHEFNLCRGTLGLTCDNPIVTAGLILKEQGEGCESHNLAQAFLTKTTPLVEKLERVEEIAYSRGYSGCLLFLQRTLEEEIEGLRAEFICALREAYLSILRREYEWLGSCESISLILLAHGCEFTSEGKLVEYDCV